MQVPLVVDLAVLIVYFAIGSRVTNAAYAHLREPDRDLGYTPIYEPEKFHPEGEPLRRRAIQYWLVGGLAVMLYFVILS